MTFSVGTVVEGTVWLQGVTNGTTTFTDAVETPFADAAHVANFPNLTSVGSGVGGADLVTTIQNFVTVSNVTLATAATGILTSAFLWGNGTGAFGPGLTQISVTCKDAIQAGDTLVVCLMFDGAASVVSLRDSSGNRYQFLSSASQTIGGSNSFLAVYVARNCAPAAAGTNKVTLALSAVIARIITSMRIVPVRGVASVDTAASNTTSGNGTVMTSAIFSAPYHNFMVLAFSDIDVGNATGQAGYTIGPSDPFLNVYQYNIFAQPQFNITTTVTCSGTTNWLLSTVVLRGQVPVRARPLPIGL